MDARPGRGTPDEIDSSATASTGTFTGAEPGEGLDFAGQIVYAVNVRGPGGMTVGDAVFTADDETDGVTVTAQNEILSWGEPQEFGETEDDNNLEQSEATHSRDSLMHC
eukprot:SAG31_NODE_13470_length_867_cov_0.805990_2_plen_109_part_00